MIETSERRVKIVCTLGPSSREPARLKKLVAAGMDVARLNLSHGTHEEHATLIERVRHVSRETGRAIGILLDLQGPKIRTGLLPGGVRRLRRGEIVVLAPSTGPDVIPVSLRTLARDVRPSQILLLDDGLLRLRVLSIAGNRVRCRVEEGGPLGDHKGINVPGAALSVPALTPKDLRDLAFGLAQGVDFIALSFVRRAADVDRLRRRMGARHRAVPIIAKLEKPQAIEDLDAILEAADGVMVARGDLGVEILPEEVPLVQKRIIERANRARKPVITATQMLESMVERSRPTRAEASDVANAVLDGTDAVMLSAETASGRHPVESVTMMSRILRRAECAPVALRRGRAQAGPAGGAEDALCETASHLAEESGAVLIVAFTQSGFTARMLSKHRPSVPIVSFTTDEEVRRRLTLLWGVRPLVLGAFERLSPLVAAAERRLLEDRLAHVGDRVILVMGYPLGKSSTTNLLKIHTVGGGRG